MTEAEVLSEYSTPGLKKCELSRAAKKEHLADIAKNLTPEEREAILDQLYGPEQTDG